MRLVELDGDNIDDAFNGYVSQVGTVCVLCVVRGDSSNPEQLCKATAPCMPRPRQLAPTSTSTTTPLTHINTHS